MPGGEVIGDSFDTFLFEVWRWLPHILRHREDALLGIVRCRTSSTTTALIGVREVKYFEVGMERDMSREKNYIISNTVTGTETHSVA
ncbi:hypothetical protein AVEN_169628-1 [Araneus ventricosus]|uniref:Uncharacterized protein n=1 Tax=Araneus ventricosus TaxID=182803 RepID=A0A4Y2WYJ5_ARAVE|nr:hypothetical protein AVEN_169628-1 [Araneus ventricosus]